MEEVEEEEVDEQEEEEEEEMVKEQNRRRRGERHSRRRRRRWFSWETKERERKREISSQGEVAGLKAPFSSPKRATRPQTSGSGAVPTVLEFMNS